MAESLSLNNALAVSRDHASGARHSSAAPAWRKALEDAAWRDSLGAIDPFIEHQKHSHQSSEAAGKPASEKPACPKPSLSETAPRAAEAARSTGTLSNQDALQIPLASTGFQMPTPVIPDSWASPRQLAPGSPALPTEQLDSAGLPRAGMRCPKRNVTTTNQADGIEIWIRDAQATPEQVMALLAPLRKTMGETGAQLLRISLNGSPVWLAASLRPTIPQVKE